MFSQRFSNHTHSIQSTSWECNHAKHWEVVLLCKRTGKRQVLFHDHNYRLHWAHMYEASERLILGLS